MPRETKIVATLGPASSSPEILTRLIAAGVDVVRMNFSHGAAQDHIDRAKVVRDVAASLGAKVVREEVRGYGRAYKRGFADATSDIIITLDGDHSYPVDALST